MTEFQVQTKTSTRAATGAGIVFFSQVAGYGLFFLAQRIILSTLSKDEYGAMSYTQLMCSLALMVLVDAGMNTVAVREMIAHPTKQREVISTTFWLRLIGTIVVGLAILGYVLIAQPNSWQLVVLAISMISLSSKSAMIRSSVELPFRESLQFSTISLCFIADWVLYFAALLYYRNDLHPMRIFSLQLVSSIPGFVYLAYRIGLWRIIFPLPEWSFVKDFIRHVIPLSSQLVLQNIHGSLDLFLVKTFSSAREVGILNAVANMSQVIYTTFVALSSVMLPMVADAIQVTKTNAHYRIERSLSFIAFAVILLATMLSTLAPFIAHIFTKDVYADNVLQFQLQFWVAAIASIAQGSLLINAAQHQHRAVFYSGLFLVLGSLSADFILIPQGYSVGYLIAKMWSNSLSGGVSLYFVAKANGSALVRRVVLRTLVLSAVCLPYSLFSLRYGSQWVSALVAIPLCTLLAWSLKLVGPDEIALSRKLLGAARNKFLTRSAQA